MHGDLDVEDRRADRGAEQRAVAAVVGVGDEGDARRQQLGPRGLDHDVVTAVGAVEGEAVVGAGALPVLELGLGDRGLERDVPQRGRLGDVGLAPGEVAQERGLRRAPGMAVDGGVGERPVDRQPEVAPELLEGLLVLGRERLAQLDEVAPGDGPGRCGRLCGRREVGVVGEGGVAGHAVEVLDPPLGGQAVVVPAHRVEDLGAPHAPIAGDRVGVGVGEDVADVEGARHRRRRGVDGVDLRPGLGAVEAVGAAPVPRPRPSAARGRRGRACRAQPCGEATARAGGRWRPGPGRRPAAWRGGATAGCRSVDPPLVCERLGRGFDVDSSAQSGQDRRSGGAWLSQPAGKMGVARSGLPPNVALGTRFSQPEEATSHMPTAPTAWQGEPPRSASTTVPPPAVPYVHGRHLVPIRVAPRRIPNHRIERAAGRGGRRPGPHRRDRRRPRRPRRRTTTPARTYPRPPPRVATAGHQRPGRRRRTVSHEEPLPAIDGEPTWLSGRELRAICLAFLRRTKVATTLRQLHVLLHRAGYGIASAYPVKTLADAPWVPSRSGTWLRARRAPRRYRKSGDDRHHRHVERRTVRSRRPARAAKAVMEGTLKEDGCLHYCFTADLVDPSVVHLVERWESEAPLTPT